MHALIIKVKRLLIGNKEDLNLIKFAQKPRKDLKVMIVLFQFQEVKIVPGKLLK